MGNALNATEPPVDTSKSVGKKICCVCKDTKTVRDECFVSKGQEQCKNEIMAHNRCLRNEGFDVKIDSV
eukprot:CAMPEP_0204305668 /NCGR_PEP_ID=MMETSP0468-20130131/85040_1 /ASSEMBLY_ACC=CAM_ASM_000383 /TAXON_ID=2969 /ORGANISM="Oxyrrhis marina" /LENGTH=68 /DNA_ID=CAMNT_0051285015 /DNA_START=50 /DNA_END=256 /DNA_ORIENTATION=+